MVTPEGLKVNHRLTEAVWEFPHPTDVTEVCRFLGLASYYRRFIKQFAKIAEPLRALTCKGVEFKWTTACQESMDQLKQMLVSSPVLAYPSFKKPFQLETDASVKGIGAVLSQQQDDQKFHPVAFASRSLTAAERNYSITELETLAVVWAVDHFHPYLYGNSVTIVTDHAAVRAVLQTSNPSGKHARWWTKVYGTGVEDVKIVYRAGKLNQCADALSRAPLPGAPPEGIGEDEVQIAIVQTEPQEKGGGSIEELLQSSPVVADTSSFSGEQGKDPEVCDIIQYLQTGDLPADDVRARRIVLQGSQFALVDGILYFLDPKQRHRRRAVVPSHLCKQVLTEHHSSAMGGHFAGKKMYGALVRGMGCIGILYNSPRVVQSVQLCRVVVDGTGHPFIPYQSSVPSKSLGWM